MPRRNRRQRTNFREADGLPPEQLAKAEFRRVPAPRLPGHDHGNAMTLRREPIAARWFRDGWIDRDELEALSTWLTLFEAGSMDRVRSCLDDSPRGTGDSARPERAAFARVRWLAVNKAILGQAGGMIGGTVWSWLLADTWPDYCQETGLARDAARALARDWVRKVGGAAVVAVAR